MSGSEQAFEEGWAAEPVTAVELALVVMEYLIERVGLEQASAAAEPEQLIEPGS